MTTSANGESPRLLDQVRELIRIRHYSLRTEQAYSGDKKLMSERRSDPLASALAPSSSAGAFIRFTQNVG